LIGEDRHSIQRFFLSIPLQCWRRSGTNLKGEERQIPKDGLSEARTGVEVTIWKVLKTFLPLSYFCFLSIWFGVERQLHSILEKRLHTDSPSQSQSETKISPKMAYTIDEVNKMDYEEFIKTFENVIEHCGLCAASIWRHHPFENLRHLHKNFCSFVDKLPSIGHEGILRSHPDLAGRIALQGLLTTESTKEQLAAELNTLSDSERSTLNDLNEKYKNKFGFPFVICARENKKNKILTGMAERLHNTHEVELKTGVEEVKKIAFYRLLDLIKHADAESIL